MGLVTQTITFTLGLVPAAADWTAQFDAVYNLVNGQLDSANVDKTSSDGIMVLDTAQTRTGTLTHNADILIGNTYGLLIGGATQVAGGGVTSELEVLGTAGADSSGLIGRWSADASGPILYLGKSRNATVGSFTIIQDNDILGEINFLGDDGTDIATPGASIFARVNGTPGANDLPTELVFCTTADGGNSVTERMAILATGNIQVGGTVLSDTDATDDLGTAAAMFRAMFCSAAYGNPIRLGSLRLWYDSANTTLRVKHGSDPSSASDGNPIMEG